MDTCARPFVRFAHIYFFSLSMFVSRRFDLNNPSLDTLLPLSLPALGAFICLALLAPQNSQQAKQEIESNPNTEKDKKLIQLLFEYGVRSDSEFNILLAWVDSLIEPRREQQNGSKSAFTPIITLLIAVTTNAITLVPDTATYPAIESFLYWLTRITVIVFAISLFQSMGFKVIDAFTNMPLQKLESFKSDLLSARGFYAAQRNCSSLEDGTHRV